jgi:CRP-like cAMP-binding protein
MEHKKGQLIYDQDQPSTSIYLVIDGRVKAARLASGGRQTVVGIYRKDDFFGESALLGLLRRPEQATALEKTRVMAWSAAEVEDISQKRPLLAIRVVAGRGAAHARMRTTPGELFDGPYRTPVGAYADRILPALQCG